MMVPGKERDKTSVDKNRPDGKGMRRQPIVFDLSVLQAKPLSRMARPSRSRASGAKLLLGSVFREREVPSSHCLPRFASIFAAAFHARGDDEYRLCSVRVRQLSQAPDRLRRAESRFRERQHPIS